MEIPWQSSGSLPRIGPSSIPGRGTKIPQAAWCGQKKKRKKNARGDSSQHLLGTNCMQGGVEMRVMRKSTVSGTSQCLGQTGEASLRRCPWAPWRKEGRKGIRSMETSKGRGTDACSNVTVHRTARPTGWGQSLVDEVAERVKDQTLHPGCWADECVLLHFTCIKPDARRTSESWTEVSRTAMRYRTSVLPWKNT